MRVVDRMLSPLNLKRIADAEHKIPADQDAFTNAELLERLTKAVYSEVDTLKEGEYTTRKPAISSLRRNLQRYYLKELGGLALGQRGGAPEDCQTIAFAELTSLDARIDKVLKSNVKLDPYSRAHLQETSGRIRKILDAHLSVSTP